MPMHDHNEDLVRLLIIVGGVVLAMAFVFIAGRTAHAALAIHDLDCGTYAELVFSNLDSGQSRNVFLNPDVSLNCPVGCAKVIVPAFASVTFHCSGLFTTAFNDSFVAYAMLPLNTGTDPKTLATMLLLVAFILGVATGGIRS